MIDVNKYKTIKTQAACIDGEGIIWIFSNLYNALFKLNPFDEKIEYVTSFFREPLFSESLYTKAILYEDRIYFIPCTASNVAIYDIRAEKTDYIYIEEEFYNYNVLQFGVDKVFLFPVACRAWGWAIDMSKNEAIKVDLDYAGNEDFFITRGNICFSGNAFVEGKGYLSIYGTNKYLEYDVWNNECVIKKMRLEKKYTGAFRVNKSVYFLSLDGTSADCYFPKKDEWGEGLLFPYQFTRDIFCNGDLKAYAQVISIDGNKMLSIPSKGNKVLWYTNGQMIKSADIDWEEIGMENEDSQAFVISLDIGDMTIMLPYQCKCWVKIVDNKTLIRHMVIGDDAFLKSVREYRKHNSILEDGVMLNEKQMPLKLFIELC